MRTLWLVLPVLALVGCQKKEEKSEPKAPTSIIGSTDMSPGTVGSLDKTGVASKLYESGNFKANSDIGSQLTDSGTDCLTAKLDALTVTAEKSNVTLNTTVDVKDCLAAIVKDATVKNATVKLLYWFGCQDDS